MLIGTLQLELLIHGAESLKDKRRVVRSLKDRLHREHLVSVAEVARHDAPQVAVIGLALVGHDGHAVSASLDRILAKVRALVDAELGEVTRRSIRVDPGDVGARENADPMDPGQASDLAAELEAYFADDGTTP